MWIGRLNLVRGLFFQVRSSLTSLKSQTRYPKLKVPPGWLVLRIFTSWKNPSTSAGIESANRGSRGETDNWVNITKCLLPCVITSGHHGNHMKVKYFLSRISCYKSLNVQIIKICKYWFFFRWENSFLCDTSITEVLRITIPKYDYTDQIRLDQSRQFDRRIMA
jgi:hypothetical protein